MKRLNLSYINVICVLSLIHIFPGKAFTFPPVTGIYTHFPADEDKPLDLGRLGEECKRFKAIYEEADSCLLYTSRCV